VHVQARFSAAVARHVEESTWHASQELTKEKDGSLLGEFDLDSTAEIKRWILGFGQNAVVVEPEALKGEIVAECSQLLRSYGPTRNGQVALIELIKTRKR
jgi:predicted DNA-binding transcriptional regulator YafY